MKLRILVSLAAVTVTAALPALGSAQVRHYRTHNSGRTYYNVPTYSRTSYGYGPFYPSYIPAPSYQYYGPGGPYRFGGTTFYFGSGGGYTATYPYGYYAPRYSRPYSHRYHRSWR